MTITAQPVNASAGSPAFSALQSRQAFSAHIANGSSRVLGTLSGYTPGRTPTTLTATSTTWTIGAFAALIDPAFTTTQSVYEFASDANATGSVTAANGSNPRKDILYATVNDTDIDSSGLRSGTISYLAGTAASLPAVPATPARSFQLAVISVPTSGGGSPTIALNPTYQVAAGGVLPCLSTARPGTPYVGMTIFQTDLLSVVTWDGANWTDTSRPKLLGVGTGTTPAAGTLIRSYETSFVVTASASNWSVTFATLGIPNFSTGYTPHVSLGDNNVGQVMIANASCTLTTLVGQVWTTAGAPVTGAARINLRVSGA